jgi:hypothetical protein
MKPAKTSARSISGDAHGREDVVDVVAAELAAIRVGEYEGHHRLAHHPGGGHGGGVGALAQGLGRLLGLGVDRAQWLGQGRERLHGHPGHERLARGHATLEAARAVGLAVVAAFVGEEDLVVGLRAVGAGEVEALPEPNRLHGLDRHERAGQAAVQALLPGDVAAQPGDETERAYLEQAAERLVLLAHDVDLLDHRLGGRVVQAAHRRLVHLGEVLRAQARALGGRDLADLDHVGEDLDAEGPQEGLGQGATRHPGRRLARAGALEDVAHVGVAVLLAPGQVGVAGAREMDLGDLGLHRPRVHPLLPVGVVAVGHLQRDRAAEGAPVADARRDLRRVGLDLHPAAAAVAELAAREVAVEVLGGDLEAGRQALQDAGQARPVRLACGDEAEAHGPGTLRTGSRQVPPLHRQPSVYSALTARR